MIWVPSPGNAERFPDQAAAVPQFPACVAHSDHLMNPCQGDAISGQKPLKTSAFLGIYIVGNHLTLCYYLGWS
jgi:hypothetical protein